jgi:anionic cell wall polymer biosynthesis LytR-Cps2A-Psr (LCP) family protein
MMAIIAVVSFQGVTRYLTGSFYDMRNVNKKEETATAETTPVKKDEVVEEKDAKNTLFFVESKDGMSRYTALVMMNKKTKAADLLLIPLHVQVTVGGKLLNNIQKKIPDAGSTVELDDIARVYGDEKYSMISEIFSQILGVNIAGYDVISQERFEDLLDIVNPVSYKFSDILSYRDDKQNLQYFESGYQNINGSEAMILMSHMDGTEKQESDRLERCNTYLESWIGKVLDKGKGGKMVDTIKKNATASQGRDYTDEKELWSSIKGDAVTLRILQGAENKGVFSIDSQKAKLQIATLVKQSAEYDSSAERDSVDSDDSLDDDDEDVASSKDYYIELYNAAFREGLASEWQRFLEDEGYNISMIDSYQDEGLISTTRIVVSQEGMGQDLLKYFPEARIETGEIETGGDIQVYLGTDSSNVGVSEDYSDSDKDKDEESDDSDDEDKDSKDKDEDDQDDEDDDDKDSDSSKKSGYYNFDKDSE